MSEKIVVKVEPKTETKCTKCTSSACLPPKYADLNKRFKDLASDDFGFGEYKLSLKAKTADGVNLKAEETIKASDKSVSTLLEAKYTHVAQGLSLKGSVDTKANQTLEVALDKLGVKGLKATATSKCSPTATSWLPESWKLKAEFINDKVATETVFDGKDVTANAVTALPFAKVGVSTTYNLGKGAITSTGIAAKFCVHGTAVTTSLTDLAELKASAVHGCRTTTYGAEASYNLKTGATGFTAVTKSVIDADSFIKTTFGSDYKFGVAYTQKVTTGLTLTLAAQTNLTDVTADKQTVGASLTFEK